MEPREYTRSFALEDTHWWFRAKRALVRALLARHGWRGGRGLDVGCGTGGTLQALAGHGRWIGVDAEPLALAFARQRGLEGLVQGSAVALPFKSGAFDACLCLDVLYHRGVSSEAAALAECHRVLREGGLLILTDAALAWLRSAHDEAVHGARRYTRGALVAMLRAAGFHPLLASYAYCLVFPGVALLRLLRRARGARAGAGSDLFPLPRPLTAVLLAIQAVERALLRLGPLPVGSSVVLVARKPAVAPPPVAPPTPAGDLLRAGAAGEPRPPDRGPGPPDASPGTPPASPEAGARGAGDPPPARGAAPGPGAPGPGGGGGPRVGVVLPTYNERAVVVDLVREILAALPEAEVLVVDDDSPDRTWEAVEAAFAGDGRARVLRRVSRRGLPSALAEGIAATAADVVVWLDADGSMPPAVIPRLVAATATADVVVASRYAPGGRDARDSRLRVLASRAINRLATCCLGGPVRDWTSGFVAARRAALARVPLRTHYAYGDYCIDFLDRACRASLRVVEVPYTCVERRAGETKTSPGLGRFLGLGLRYAQTILRLRAERRAWGGRARRSGR